MGGAGLAIPIKHLETDDGYGPRPPRHKKAAPPILRTWHKKTALRINASGFLCAMRGSYKNNTAGNTAIANTIKIHSARHRFRWPV
jgi:hypothetical protein